MLLNPTDRYLLKKGIRKAKLEVAKNMLDEGFNIEKIVKITELSENDILRIQ